MIDSGPCRLCGTYEPVHVKRKRRQSYIHDTLQCIRCGNTWKESIPDNRFHISKHKVS